MATEKKDRPWWSKNHTLWGGETFHSKKSKSKLGIKSGDVFRIEKDLAGNITLIPHPANEGTWNESHSETSPIILTDFPITDYERAYSMMVKITKNAAPKQLYLVERFNGTIFFTEDADDPGQNGGTAAVER